LQFAGRLFHCPIFRMMRAAWAKSEDMVKIFTRGLGLAQVVVGVKKNRPR
jgi:hypothetical protein